MICCTPGSEAMTRRGSPARSGHRARLFAADVDLLDLGTERAHGGLVALAGEAGRETEQLHGAGRAGARLDGLVGGVVSGVWI